MTNKSDEKFLRKKIEKEFPNLQFNGARLIEAGGDNIILILDERYVFRFPRTKRYEQSFSNELRLLTALASHKLPCDIPRYVFVSKQKHFGGYKIIQGGEFRFNRYRVLSKTDKHRSAKQLATFLKILHSLKPHVFDGELIPLWDAEQYEKRYKREGRPVLKPFLKSKTLARLDDFFRNDLYKAYATAPKKTVIHGDLADDHILMANRKITGIIDFSDATIGDPSFDFTFFWFYGENFIHDVLGEYGKVDKGFKERSRAHFIRFVSRNLWLALEREKPTLARWWLSYVEKHLSRPFHFGRTKH